jgi:hypothetical protein
MNLSSGSSSIRTFYTMFMPIELIIGLIRDHVLDVELDVT